MTGAAPHGYGSGAARDATVAVVGGGIAGLSAAWAITSVSPRTHVIVLESDGRLGGKLQTGTIGGRAVELGPDAFLARRPEAVNLCRELGLGDELVSPGSRRAYVWARGKLRRLPAGLALGVPTRLGPLARSGILSPWGVGRAALDPLRWRSPRGGQARAHGDRPVAAITRRDLGHEVTARLVDPLIGGIHAGDTTQMSTAAVFPALLDAAERGGSLMRALRAVTPAPPASTGPGAHPDGDPPVFHTVRGGLSRLVDGLGDALGARGVDVRLDARVEHLERHAGEDRDTPLQNGAARWTLHSAPGPVEADALIIATPATAASALLEPVDHAIAAMLGAIAYAEVTLVTLRLRAEDVGNPLEGTGFLVPASSGSLITACTWLTSKWPELRRNGDVLLRASTGRFGDDRAARLCDEELIGRVLDELGPMLGLRGAPIDVVVTRWTEAFPQYGVGHLERVAAIEEAAGRLPALALAGAAYRGVGIPACIASGQRAADAVLAQLHRARQSTP
jgi:protoporphyrinogen/coproporphyrinogen III oxidase